MRGKPRFSEFEIGPSGTLRRLFSWAGYVVFFVLVSAAFVYVFVLLTMSWRIAVGSVVLLAAYMFAMAWWAERHASGRDDSMR